MSAGPTNNGPFCHSILFNIHVLALTPVVARDEHQQASSRKTLKFKMGVELKIIKTGIKWDNVSCCLRKLGAQQHMHSVKVSDSLEH